MSSIKVILKNFLLFFNFIQKKYCCFFSKGHHGYDPYHVEEMKTLMYASGPKLKKNYLNSPLMMTDHYNLICNLLEMKPLTNDGNWTKVQSMLEDGTTNNLANNTIGQPNKLAKVLKSIKESSNRQKRNSVNLLSSSFNLIYLFIILSFFVSSSQFRI